MSLEHDCAFDGFIYTVKTKFSVSVDVEPTKHKVFASPGALFKRPLSNEYCFAQLSRNGVPAVSFFKSDHRDFEKIEDDYLESSTTFLTPTREIAETIIEYLH